MKTKPAYDIDYFIRKFGAIPSDQIGKGGIENQCALYHCGVIGYAGGEYRRTPEATALARIFAAARGRKYDVCNWAILIYSVNDNSFCGNTTPKERIMRMLRLAKRKGVK